MLGISLVQTPATAAKIAAVIGACAALITGCSSATTGTPKTATAGPESGANVALMDTGPYDTASGRPFGSAGDDVDGANLLESQRMAEFVVGPWEVDAELTRMPGAIGLGMIGPVPSIKLMRDNEVLKDDLIAVADKHRFMNGFSTIRLSPEQTGQNRGLHNLVLRFPDPAAADAAATEMAAVESSRPDQPPAEPVTVNSTPEARAVAYTLPDGLKKVVSFTAHGPYLLYQEGQASQAFLGKSAANLVDGALIIQKRRIDEFSPTPPAAMRDLPLDPSGQLLARTLIAPDGRAPFIIGVWNSFAWLHFELDPLQANSLFNTAGVDIVGQRLSTVYQAANADGALRVAKGLDEQIENLPSVREVDGVPGLPGATCFQRTEGGLPGTSPSTWQRVVWQYKCVATVDRYAYTAFSDTAVDVRQQMAAQYRILAGQ
ncbi:MULTISPECIES: DUF7373 family lipoprotein [Mycobacteriaceae]|jgi:hypothetical protein|uniref:DUF7373 family lipoprotein n=1 Tax=Mycobacteriaceae TaxID=1762 RepID=UPI00071625E6|nr:MULTISPECIES: hypothetical protein [Mycobacteriaceae]KRQ20729.1 hypothetical protein AOT87_17500 [Mycobacteroides sp. H003]KRQ35582.1 hypothetical protein AOT91_04000 [Mycobacteroides sp. H092]KRQ48248.1 hypothetical protein AOT92_00180 [Mycobacteroides sp. H101]KRQ53398.1 hypothetical protein AOT88_00165 [Mycobacteroides sp. H063]KRQ63186.1 hypothetical protein AOT94_01970 [Mycobacteroides sp. HXVII]KRQ67611.1 hypothetical protein AOT90_03425 [Mycobacteroides sp. H079]KRQ74292.1 hypothet